MAAARLGKDSPVLQAYKVYQRERCYRTFHDDVDLHMLNGYVYATPDIFVMGRPVDKTAPHNDILDPAVTFHRDDWNCWHCALYAGNLSILFTLLPFELPYASFQKRNKLKFYSYIKIKERFARC